MTELLTYSAIIGLILFLAFIQRNLLGRVVILILLLNSSLFASDTSGNYIPCDRELTESISNNNQTKFAELLGKQIEVNCGNGKSMYDNCPLMSAVSYKRIEMVNALLTRGANVNVQDRDGLTPLMIASDSDSKMIDILLSFKADPNIKTKDGFNVLSGLAHKGKFDLCKYLIERGGDPRILNDNGDTLAQAAWKHLSWVIYDEGRVIEFVNFLMKRGLDLSAINEDNKTIADLAFSSRHVNLLRLVDIGNKYTSQLAALKPITAEEKIHRAIFRKDVEAVRNILATEHPDLFYLDPLSKTPALIAAVRENEPEIVKLILEAGSPVDVKDSSGATAMDNAVRNKNDGVIKILIAANAKPTNRTLIDAVKSGNVENVKNLVKKGVDVNARGPGNYTALMAAVEGHFPAIVDYLLGHKADVELRNARGKTAADIAAEALDLDMLRRVDRNGTHKDFLAQYTPRKDSPFLGTWSMMQKSEFGGFGFVLKDDGTAILGMVVVGLPAVWKDKGNGMELTGTMEGETIVLTGTLIPLSFISNKTVIPSTPNIQKGQPAEAILIQQNNDKFALKVAIKSVVDTKPAKANKRGITVDQVKQNKASVEDLIWLIEGHDRELAKYIQWEQLSPDVLEQLATSKWGSYGENIAKQANCTEKALATLSDSPYPNVREVVANQSKTPLHTLMKLTGRDQPFYVRLAAARSPKMSPEVYVQILEEGSKSIKKDKRRLVARDPRSTREIQERLSTDVHEEIRREIAHSPTTDPRVLDKMASDEDQIVRRTVARNGNSSVGTFDKLSRDKESQVRAVVAANKKTPVSILERLASDPDYYVQLGVVENEQTPDFILKLFADGKSNLRGTAARILSRREAKRGPVK